ncbi:SpoIIE family protein phosphatase [Desulfobacula sp.]|uniref:SpoIIE family protein phosphatase n=1 Tax=Desulfobacula sp. TaxID=2593537 RepID=UPI002626080F|nr:SpoIIE family protein phosphatase [Desulfobacula sp.]
MQPKTLQHRIMIFILIPVFFILTGMGWISFLYTRNAMLKQWGETAIAKLQKSSHMIDMRLSRTKYLLSMLKNNYSQDQGHIVHRFIVEQLQEMEGVVEVNSDFLNDTRIPAYASRRYMVNPNPMPFGRMEKFQLSFPQYNAKLNSETVSLSTDVKDKIGKKIGRIEVVISFQDLIDQISKANWWKNNKAFLIDHGGNILISTQQNKEIPKSDVFADTDPLEKKTLEALKQNPYGTIFGPGHPPDEISGYYHLIEAPWSLVLISPGNQVLKPIINFRRYYFIVGFLSIICVLLFIRISITGTANSIKRVSEAAKHLANGTFSQQLPVLSKDEVGELTYNFNKMTQQLKERLELKEAMNLAMKVQQGLLPPTNFSYKNIEISGRSVYCDQTGGDYFDIIEFPDEPGKICVAVGDVVGHGIGAALLMATTRALLRSRVTQKGSLSRVMNDVNRLLCLDTRDTGSFVTLFLLMVDVNKDELQWVRAGHEPAMFYSPEQENITELKGEGIVLGVDKDWTYTKNFQYHIPKGTVVLIGTDGTWEVENKSGERLGKKSVEKVLQKSILLSSEEIVHSIISETQKFRGDIQQNDDITLLVLKFL